MAENFRLAGIGKNDELVAEIAADRAGIGAHGDRSQTETVEGAQIGGKHLVVRMNSAFLRQIEGIGILHHEFARAHRAEARADLVAELQLNMIEVQRQVLVGLDGRAEDIGDHLLIGRTIEHRPVLPVLDAQHLLAIGVIAAAFLPEFGRL